MNRSFIKAELLRVFPAGPKTFKIMMTIKEIKSNLCYYDLQNPERTVDEETAKEINQNNSDCYCDNCFNGKTELAKELLRYYYIVNEK